MTPPHGWIRTRRGRLRRPSTVPAFYEPRTPAATGSIRPRLHLGGNGDGGNAVLTRGMPGIDPSRPSVGRPSNVRGRPAVERAGPAGGGAGAGGQPSRARG